MQKDAIGIALQFFLQKAPEELRHHIPWLTETLADQRTTIEETPEKRPYIVPAFDRNDEQAKHRINHVRNRLNGTNAGRRPYSEKEAEFVDTSADAIAGILLSRSIFVAQYFQQILIQLDWEPAIANRIVKIGRALHPQEEYLDPARGMNDIKALHQAIRQGIF